MNTSNVSTSLEIQTQDFSSQQRSLLNDRLGRVQASLEVIAKAQNILVFSVTGTLVPKTSATPLQAIPTTAKITSACLLLKTAPRGTVTVRVNVNSAPFGATLGTSSTFVTIPINGLTLQANQPVSIDITSVGSPAGADLTVILQGTYQ